MKTGTKLGIAALALAVGTTVLWFRLTGTVGLPDSIRAVVRIDGAGRSTGVSVDFTGMLQGNFDHALTVGGESSDWWGPMGVAVIWGLAVATFLTLLVVPTLYALIEEGQRKLKRLRERAGRIGWKPSPESR